MEVPAVEDSMEMASPYQGQADDFDIDIDFMEEHDNASNMDSDMMGAEDYTNASQPTEFNEAIHDADMADEPSEGSMVDADLVDQDNDIDVNFAEETYEAEMIEDDQVEDVDIPVPTIQLEDTATNKDPSQPSELNEAVPVMAEQPTLEVQETTSVPTEPEQDQSEPQASEAQLPSTEVAPIHEDETLAQNPAESGINTENTDDHEKADLGQEVNETKTPSVMATDKIPEVSEGIETSQAQSSREELQQAAVAKEPAEVQPPHKEPDHAEHGAESLHPVKIYYQDNEIALFPPLEGDSAETFFLHDEDVAYENISELFKALRQVLQGNVADNDVLVIDIDVLGIQMTEDSFHASQVTLHQVVDLYLRLCQNDGTTDAEALYLTLSSKRAFPAEIADLLDAANEGKGLSGIHQWAEYDEFEENSEDDLAINDTEQHEDGSSSEGAQPEHSDQEVKPEISGQEQPPTHGEGQSQDDPHDGSHTNDLPQEDNTSAVVQEETQEETQAAAEYDAPQGQPESKEIDQYTQLDQFDGEHAQEDGFPHDDQAKTHEDQNEDHYDSEGQQSESTATVAPLSGEAETTEQIEDVTVDAADANDDENSGLDDYYNDEDNGFGDDQQNFHDEFDGENNDAGAQEPADHAPGPDEDGDELDAAPTDEVVSTDAFNNAEDETFQDQTESTLNGVPKDAAAKEQTPDHADDLLEIAPDVLQTPAKDIARESLDQKEGVDSGEPEHNLAHNEGADEQHFNDDHFGQTDDNLEESEAVVLAETDHSLADSEPSANLSAKRSREDDDDDEWDLVETTIDTKRRRS